MGTFIGTLSIEFVISQTTMKAKASYGTPYTRG